MQTAQRRTGPAGTDAEGQRVGVHGILGQVAVLDRWLHGVLVVLIIVCAARYVMRHPFDATAVFILAGAAALAVVYATRPLVRDRAWGPAVWVALVVALWLGLTLVAPSFAWTAVPLAFAALQVFPFPLAVGVVVLMTVVVSLAWSRITEGPDPTVVVGPVGIALVTVIAYRALDLESRTRQLLLDDLTEAQTDLVVAQRRSGALAERTRISREIHDSVGQGLSSINLLLNAAEQDGASTQTSLGATCRPHQRPPGMVSRRYAGWCETSPPRSSRPTTVARRSSQPSHWWWSARATES